MKIAITGATGFVGGHLCPALESDGHQLVRLGRNEVSVATDQLAERMLGCQLVINLAGENISRRWTESYMQAIYDSRILTTRRLVEAMQQMDSKPDCFISTSAMGAFASHGQYSESDPPNGTDFLARLAHDWEREAEQAETLGVRTLIFRFGLVLGADGGLMKSLLPPFRLGLGGPIGDGRQPFCWIHIQDLVDAYRFALAQPQMRGVYHLCAPEPANNLDFTKSLGHVLHRPTLLPMPKWVLKLMFGPGGEVMASGQQMIPKRLPEAGFRFTFDSLPKALTEIVAKN